MSRKRRKKITFFTEIVIGLAFTLAFLMASRVVTFSVGSGDSMLPNLPPHNFSIGFNVMPERGDIVAIYANDNHPPLKKRVVALPNETIEIKDSVVYINNEPYDDPYKWINPETLEIYKNYPLTTLNEDEYFVLGDNRNSSVDSRTFGPININEINSVVKWTIGIS